MCDEPGIRRPMSASSAAPTVDSHSRDDPFLAEQRSGAALTDVRGVAIQGSSTGRRTRDRARVSPDRLGGLSQHYLLRKTCVSQSPSECCTPNSMEAGKSEASV